MLQGIARLAIAAPRRIIGLALLVMVAAGIFGLPVTKTLSAGGFNDPSSQSAKASALLVDKFHQSDTDLIITVTSEGGMHSAAAQAVAGQVVALLKE